jgi:hypothetical protein|tara:strand:+ start:344 stop:610 length:267 start_codon:yes stop_codon:yes gene_type:complete
MKIMDENLINSESSQELEELEEPEELLTATLVRDIEIINTEGHQIVENCDASENTQQTINRTTNYNNYTKNILCFILGFIFGSVLKNP